MSRREASMSARKGDLSADERADRPRRRDRHGLFRAPEILGMSDRVLVIHEGTLSGELSRNDATQERIMTLATGGR